MQLQPSTTLGHGGPPGMLGRDGVPDRQPGVVAQGVGIWRQLRTFQQDGADHPGVAGGNRTTMWRSGIEPKKLWHFFFQLLDFHEELRNSLLILESGSMFNLIRSTWTTCVAHVTVFLLLMKDLS